MDATGTVESLTDDEDTNEREAEGTARLSRFFPFFPTQHTQLTMAT